MDENKKIFQVFNPCKTLFQQKIVFFNNNDNTSVLQAIIGLLFSYMRWLVSYGSHFEWTYTRFSKLIRSTLASLLAKLNFI